MMNSNGHGSLLRRFASVAAIVATTTCLGNAQEAEFGFAVADPVGEGVVGFPPQLKVFLDDQDSGKYWLGIICHEASPELRSQLGLNDGEGLVVARVAPDSPAAKAGLKQHDVLIAAGGAKLERVADLTKAVDQTDGKELELKAIRQGKELIIAVTPKERDPNEFKKDVVKVVRPRAGFFSVEDDEDFIFEATRLPQPKLPPLPGNVEIKIIREGKQPATITIRRKAEKSHDKSDGASSDDSAAKDETWEVSEKELDQLPKDIRRLVEPMLGRMPPMVGIRGEAIPATPGRRVVIEHRGPGQKFTMPLPPPGGESRAVRVRPIPHGQPMPGEPVAGDAMPHVLKRLEMLDRRLEALQDELRQLRGPDPQRSEAQPSKSRPHDEEERPAPRFRSRPLED